jgi:hypothetical protein
MFTFCFQWKKRHEKLQSKNITVHEVQLRPNELYPT